MPTALGSLRRLLMAPPLAEVGFSARGFGVPPTELTRRLEAIPQAVVCGFEWAIDTRGTWETERRTLLVEPELRGFVYEGATMALTIRDAMGPGRGRRAAELLRGPARQHVFLNYIGIGFAMARLPRVLWKKVLPDLTGSDYYPVMSWLAVDGYGFDLAYFHTRRWVNEQRVPDPYPWEGAPDYFPRAVDQGIGRALWFIHGADVSRVAPAVERFSTHRRADLWSGVGLAATFAGCCAPEQLRTLRDAAAGYGEHLAQGAVFAAKARDYAGTVPEHTHAATAALTGLTVEAAVRLADDSSVAGRESGSLPAYELWRQNIRSGILLDNS
ncbi:DUF1702 family protein [Streptomyces clavuligerus]|nr:DUF1702 family protein [Streptomyces clavuligerus]ANW21526.1 enediyne biosynthesis protein [Streptomyces clavuligerus]AXU16157.1 DUF1702 family protein [Streptomyces clavuligerus]MBY6306305.1 DUF1702 family protein [Streptomyces clavuligerus]QCS08936.1 DUF1702 domain-containing protein [Streptomyces clavuligerus]QPJ91727.1 DUF1702 family protein [Streptomyces clavuligerus]